MTSELHNGILRRGQVEQLATAGTIIDCLGLLKSDFDNKIDMNV
jgi:hypothetical protein